MDAPGAVCGSVVFPGSSRKGREGGDDRLGMCFAGDVQQIMIKHVSGEDGEEPGRAPE
jgi:hypothetical protein